MRLPALFVCILLLAACGCGPERPPEKGAFPSPFSDPGPFVAALRQCRAKPLPQAINGLTVPHHLLAVDLLAEAFARVRGRDYRRIIILSPDHFSRSLTPFAITRRDFDTPWGRLATDREAVARLLANPLVSESNLFSHEHGVQALLPFIAHHFPRARIVPLTLKNTSQPADWEALAQSLTPLLGLDSLLVQSTDFSHYLPLEQARRRDQETLRVLSGGDPQEVLSLTAPAHLDSRGCQYLQLRLQRQVYGAGPTVMANRNSQEYAPEPLHKTTSYIVQLYSPESLPVEGARSVFFGGDAFFGRGLAKKLASPERRQAFRREVLGITGGNPLILNLEGVIAAACPENPGPYTLCMTEALTLPLLAELNVRALSLANNHSRDLGEDAYGAMRRRLAEAGIACLENRQILDMDSFYLAGFTDLNNQPQPKTALLTRQDLEGLAGLKKDKPLFAMVHWGREFEAAGRPPGRGPGRAPGG
jgi:AmmeMemoRadiSam system protein B